MSDMNEVVRVRKEKLAKCLTCPVCHDLFSDATTITECLHTFCRKCIHGKITEEDCDCCPVCKTHLGANPLDKLRADHSLQDLRTKLFGSDSLIEKPRVSVGSGSSVPTPAKPTKEPVSPAKATESKLPPEPFKAARKKSRSRRKSNAPQKFVPPVNNAIEKVEIGQKNLSSPDIVSKVSGKGKQKLEDIAEKSEGKFDQAIKDSNRSVDIASKVTPEKNKKASSLSLGGLQGGVKNLKLHGNQKVMVGNAQPSNAKPEKTQAQEDKRAIVLGISAANVMNPSPHDPPERSNPIWFSLIASHNIKEGYGPLPQITSRFLRVNKEGTMTVSIVKKYLAQKLDLSDESEVEVMMRGQALMSTLTVSDLMEIWIRTAPVTVMTPAVPGSSGENFVMVLYYARKIARP